MKVGRLGNRVSLWMSVVGDEGACKRLNLLHMCSGLKECFSGGELRGNLVEN